MNKNIIPAPLDHFLTWMYKYTNEIGEEIWLRNGRYYLVNGPSWKEDNHQEITTDQLFELYSLHYPDEAIFFLVLQDTQKELVAAKTKIKLLIDARQAEYEPINDMISLLEEIHSKHEAGNLPDNDLYIKINTFLKGV